MVGEEKGGEDGGGEGGSFVVRLHIFATYE